MLLENKVAVVYGAGGPIGGAVARAFAGEGAEVFLAGRPLAKLAALAAEIGAAGTAEVDALDEQAVNTYVDAVAEQAGRLDISVNLISYGDVQQPLTEISGQWACELGSQGVRVVTLTTGGVPESLPDTFAARNDLTAELDKATLLGRTATLADLGNVATFVASDQARTLTSTAVNISCGAIVD
jgi:NAD(P)-dependent dehydrogenase (short-subunit alcohol dehydrogenase family)